MSGRVLSRALYGLFGALYLVAGAAVLLFDSGLLPRPIAHLVADITNHDRHTLHIAQEFGTHMIILGLVTLWFLMQVDQSRLFHWAMTLGWGLFGLIHWLDVRGTAESIKGPALTTVPFALFAIVGVLRRGGGKQSA
jgi:hypothetical protein